MNNRVNNNILKDSPINLKIFLITFISIRLIISYPLGTGCKLNVICTFNLRPVSRGYKVSSNSIIIKCTDADPQHLHINHAATFPPLFMAITQHMPRDSEKMKN